jgi:hypothetical protein
MPEKIGKQARRVKRSGITKGMHDQFGGKTEPVSYVAILPVESKNSDNHQ